MDDSKKAIISLDGLADIGIALLDKLEHAIGWIVNHDTPKRVAEKTYMEEIKASNYSPIEKAAMISQSRKIIKEYANQAEIVHIACNGLNENAHPEAVSDDWIAQFMDGARLICDKELKMMWGKLLAEECNNPNSIPKGVIHILKRMDRQDAETFLKVCSNSIQFEEENYYSPIIYAEDVESKIIIKYEELANLQALGLIEFDFSILSGYTESFDNHIQIVCCGDTRRTVESDDGAFYVGNVVFNRYGQALCRSIDVERNNLELLQKFLDRYKKRNTELDEMLQD